MAEFTRQQFYEQVWSKSAVQLAKDLNISDVAIAKLCKKHDTQRTRSIHEGRLH